MIRFGFIGFGSMSSMLIKGLINQGGINQSEIIVTRKDTSRLQEIKDLWTQINLASDAATVAQNANYIFICVKPSEFKDILEEIKEALLPESHIISIAGALSIKDINKIVSCKITKFLPTVIAEVNEGISLICHNNKVSAMDKAYIETLLGSFTVIRRTPEEQVEIATIFTSCGPGLYAAILDEFVEAGLRYCDCFTREEISRMIEQSVAGTVKLVQGSDFSSVVQRVATKGGLTEEGVKVIRAGLPSVFDNMLLQMRDKQKLMSEEIHSRYIDSDG